MSGPRYEGSDGPNTERLQAGASPRARQPIWSDAVP